MAWTHKQRVTAMVILAVIIVTVIVFVFILITTISLERPQVFSLNDNTNFRMQWKKDGSYVGKCNNNLTTGVQDAEMAIIFAVEVDTSSPDNPHYKFYDNGGDVTSKQYLSWDGTSNPLTLGPNGTKFTVNFSSNGLNWAVFSSGNSLLVGGGPPCQGGNLLIMTTSKSPDYFILSNS